MDMHEHDDSRSPYRLIDRLCHDQTRRWREGEQPTVEQYLSQHPELADNEEDLFDLVYNELQLRRTLLGSEFELSELTARFPQFSRRLERQLQLHEAIQSLKDSSKSTRETLTGGSPTPATLGLSPGQQLGRYRVQRLIGAGGFGVVYLATDTQLNRDVALKIPRVDDLPDLQRKRFLQEAELAASLEHPHLVAVYDAGQIDEVSYIASAFCPGRNLAQYLREHGQPRNVRTAVEIAARLADAMDHAHQRGVVHRDLKPSNVMLTNKPCGDLPFTPQITDFGLAKLGEQRMRETTTSLVMGTPLYMAPEQYRGRGPTGEHTDIYALGVILYEMLTGKPPYEGENYFEVANAVIRGQIVSPQRLNPAVSRDLAAIVLQCIERDPAHRYKNCSELARDLRLALAGRRVSIRRPNAWERFVQWANEQQRVYDAGAVACWLAVCMVIWMTTTNIGAELLFAGNKDVENADLASEHVTAAVMVLTLVLPLFLAGVAVLRDKAWGIYLGILLTAIPVIMTLLSISDDPVVHKTVYGDNLLARFLVFTLVFLTHFVLLVMMTNALRVVWRERWLTRRYSQTESKE
ncbi:serine/threonine protein kinase [Blastopirellula sp. JC732]|uniref:Serine/threonine protein kinase n=1 Tax=Blastopirellula sediminis TaxID=2894196 RepID=A0A9X1MNY5_9BACT|nr:serine/threonine-protein kinase [Blastopirellula sediminis]MCC9605903.1 serine/threonine protein kinase [Blastopirellula sediminis]MCC9630798.1 serine/threonine protein kinase [Blastopirellula sediminis]